METHAHTHVPPSRIHTCTHVHTHTHVPTHVYMHIHKRSSICVKMEIVKNKPQYFIREESLKRKEPT
jgi:hypothetical protein